VRWAVSLFRFNVWNIRVVTFNLGFFSHVMHFRNQAGTSAST
jgi:hypothetical protein